MSLTLKDIAHELKLSKTTVSFVLSGIGTEKGISSATQQRILDYVKRVHFEPNRLAQSLVNGRTNTIGVIVPSVGDMFYSELVMEIENAAKKRGYIIVICSTGHDPHQEAKMIRTLRANQVDGLIIAPTEHCRRELVHLEADHVPFVLVDRYIPELNTNYVVADERRATEILLDNLLKNHHRIALLTPDTKATSIIIRNEAYADTLRKAKMKIDNRLVCHVRRADYQVDTVRVLDRLFEEVPEVDAMFFTTHYLASEAMLYMHQRGIDNTRFGLACFHGSPVISALAPAMNVARVPLEGYGNCAVEILFANKNTPEAFEKVHQILPSQIILNG